MRKRTIGSLCRQLACAARFAGCALLTALVVSPSTPASAQQADDLWQTYIGAAANADDRNDAVSSEALLRAALDVALATDPDGLRPPLTRLLLQFAYADLNQLDEAQKMGNLRIDLTKAEPGLLSLTRQYHRLATTFYNRWSKMPDSPPTEQARTAKTLTLEYAVRCLRVEVALERKLLPQRMTFDQMQMVANAEALLGEVLRIQGNIDESVSFLEEADQRREQFRTESEILQAASQQLSMLPRKASPQGLDDVFWTKYELGLSYLFKGENLWDEKKQAEAERAFGQAETMIKNAIGYIEPEWPNHSLTATGYFLLGRLYTVWPARFAEAEPALRRTLEIELTISGPHGGNVKVAVTTLAAFLRKMGHEDRAQQLEAQYDFRN